MSIPSREPPSYAIAALRVCCAPARREEIEGDLHELFQRRAERMGLAHARRRYVLDVADICVRQLSARGVRAVNRAMRIRGFGWRAALGTCLVVLSVGLCSLKERWAVVAGLALLGALGVCELMLYASVGLGLAKAVRRPRQKKADDAT